MRGYSINRQFALNVPYRLFFIGILGFFTLCRSDQKEIQRVEPLSEADILKSDYIEPGIKWGYIDLHGEVVIEEQFDDCRNFSDGLAAASQEGLWGYINHSGKWVVKPIYKGAWSFAQGRGRIRVLDGKYGYVDTLGLLVIDTFWDEGADFSEGIALVRKDNRFQYIDRKGKLITPDSWDMAFSFKNLYARVSNGGWWGLIDHRGKLIIPAQYDGMGQIENNRIPVQIKGKWGYLDTTAKIKIDPQFEEVTSFQDQYAAVKKGEKWFIVDQNGKPISIDFDFIQALGNHRWSGQKRDTFALLNSEGKPLSSFKYTQINQFHENKAVFSQDELFGYLDTTGQHIIPNIFLLGWDFSGGAARYSLGEGIGFINAQGKAIHNSLFPDVRDYAEGLARVQTVSR